jgi:hypothetical protein
MVDISNLDDVIDSRDVIARIEELREEIKEIEGEDFDAAKVAIGEIDDPVPGELREELTKLEALAAEASGYAPDWEHGETLIRDSYFTDYAEELCKDCGALPRDIPHYIEIDWEKTADNIRVDYTEVDYDGVSYWIR